MTIEVIAPAETYDLITLEQAKAEYGTQATDDVLSRLISEASSVIARHCNRVLVAEEVREIFRMPGVGGFILLTRYPVIVNDDASVTVVENGTELDEDDYELMAASGLLRRLRDDRACDWPSGKILVTYTGGYASLPGALTRACFLLVGRYLADHLAGRYMAVQGADIVTTNSAETPDILNDAFAGDRGGRLPPDVRTLIDHFRKPGGM
jgi:hypothetical protein